MRFAPFIALSDLAARRSVRQLLLFVFLLAFVPRLIIGFLSYHGIDAVESNFIAESLAQGRGYANPFSAEVQTGPTAFYPPLHICVKAAVFAIFRDDASRGYAMVFLASLFSGLVCASWIWMSERAGISRSVGLLAGIMAALLPIHSWLEIKGTYEVVLTAFCTIVLTGMTVGHWRSGSLDLHSALRIGIFAGAAFLLSSSASAIMGGLLVGGAVVWWRTEQRRRYACYASVALATMLLVDVPWVVRNAIVLGRPILTRDNFGLELWVSNNPAAVPDGVENLSSGHRYAQHPYVTAPGLREVQRVGEVRFFDACGRQASLWIRRNPGRFLELTAERAVLFWFPRLLRPWQTALRWLITLGGFLGLAILARQRHPLALAIGCVWLFYPLVYYLVSVQARYAYPVYQFQLLLTACALAHSPRRFGGGRHTV